MKNVDHPKEYNQFQLGSKNDKRDARTLFYTSENGITKTYTITTDHFFKANAILLLGRTEDLQNIRTSRDGLVSQQGNYCPPFQLQCSVHGRRAKGSRYYTWNFVDTHFRDKKKDDTETIIRS